jgi:HAD superfamily hydrolase (TIGR01484 family)
VKPLAELSDHTAARAVGLIFDVDDTVTRDGRLESAAFESMWALARAGLRLIAVTGRPLGWVDVIARHWPVDLAIGENGAGWVWAEWDSIHEGYFHAAEERAAQARLLARIRARVEEELPHVVVATDQRARRCDLAFDVGEHEQLPEQDVERLIRLIEAEGARAPVSSVHAHAVAGDWDKAKGAERALAEVLGVRLQEELERWIFVGDSGNDAAAFARFPVSVGVANVRAHLARLSAPPRFVTDQDRGRGFSELAERLLKSRRPR